MTVLRKRVPRVIQRRLGRDLLLVTCILLVMYGMLAVAYLEWGRAVHITISTQHYLYSSLIQAFAALAGLLLAFMGFLYQRVKDAQSLYLEDAMMEAAMLSIGSLQKKYGIIRGQVRSWYFSPHKEKLDSVDRMIVALFTERQAQTNEKQMKHLEKRLKEEAESIGKDIERYELIANLLTRVIRLEDHFNNRVLSSSVLALGSALSVIALSLAFLTSSDYLGNAHAFIALTMVTLAVASMVYVGQFFIDLLYATYGATGDPEYGRIGLEEPKAARDLLAGIREALEDEPRVQG